MTVPRDQQEDRFDKAVPVALELVGAVHDLGPQDVARILHGADLPALAVALAAMVDDTRSPSELLSWVDFTDRLHPICHPDLWGQSTGSAAVHGTRARYAAGCRGAACRAVESDYQRDRHVRRKAEARQEPAA